MPRGSVDICGSRFQNGGIEWNQVVYQIVPVAFKTRETSVWTGVQVLGHWIFPRVLAMR